VPIDTDGLQARVISLLRSANVANAAITDATRRVYDDVPQNISTGIGPYVEIAAAIETEDDSSLSDGVEHTFTLSVWSEHKGYKEAREVAQRIRRAVHRQSTYVGDMYTNMFLDDVQYLVSPDGVTRQAVIRLRCNCRT
jgi:hypothetical protein